MAKKLQEIDILKNVFIVAQWAQLTCAMPIPTIQGSSLYYGQSCVFTHLVDLSLWWYSS